ncbi:hypothetical protein [Pyrobaculum neutrophilum]|uniref:DUF1922 domain-containing protein n=1 Tax=Pyrobaculum neutrophilum (strain DSM 2338 / JCM 9278 / NBRC 100436 / V24Sta) TaxID=444157 RepID=B1YCN9_PYRNV|nr:hypothetical protein [Pyrobaculum neutrophilum]ACB39552.1 conserved hypothetical protein [Pyrobaculum neutrophilum V24Sta]
MRYAAVVCPRCARASAARADARRHQCPYCGTVFQIDQAAVIAVGSAREVREAVVRYNSNFLKPGWEPRR